MCIKNKSLTWPFVTYLFLFEVTVLHIRVKFLTELVEILIKDQFLFQ